MSIQEQTSFDQSTPATRKPSLLAKHGKPEHKRAARALGYALTLGDPVSWQALGQVLSQQLTERERAGLALMSLLALSDHTATLVMGKCHPLTMPDAPLLGYLDQAAFWADMASPDELEAYCLASFNAMSAARQTDFLGFVQGREAA